MSMVKTITVSAAFLVALVVLGYLLIIGVGNPSAQTFLSLAKVSRFWFWPMITFRLLAETHLIACAMLGMIMTHALIL